ncbi:DUF2752 domain-containing protein [Aeromicrobium sp. CF4.19]|uniref:DUF2752 domain-containing protein n=1 Tax=Aeromicrobium sp. CF4.19 TaxID=3373082 RepID=UPI003EE44E94
MTSPSPVTQRSARSRAELLVAPGLAALVAGSAVTALALRDPHEEGSWGMCPFLLLTGQPCPGCGGLRAVNELTRFDLVGALSSNAFVVLMMAAVGLAWIGWVVRRWQRVDGRMISIGNRAGIALLVAFVAFGVLRLTPWGAWLAP